MILEVLIHDKHGRLVAAAEADDAEGLELAARTMIEEHRLSLQSSIGYRATATFLADGQLMMQATDRQIRSRL
jgi:hypothetical protein